MQYGLQWIRLICKSCCLSVQSCLYWHNWYMLYYTKCTILQSLWYLTHVSHTIGKTYCFCCEPFLPQILSVKKCFCKKVTNMRYNQISHPFIPSGGKRTGSLYFTREKDVSTLAGSVDILSEQIWKEALTQMLKFW